MRFYRARVFGCEKFGHHALLRYEWVGPEPAPGQFVGVRAAGLGEQFLPRPFFVHDHREGEISLLFKVRGPVTRALADPGQEILVSAPRGQGYGLETVETTEPAALVGGGLWVSPLKLLARRLRGRGIAHRVFLEAPPEAHEDYLSWLGDSYPGSEIVPTDGSPGALTDALGSLPGYETVYVSGSRETLRSVRILREDAQLAVRERMACMDGSCYGCVVPADSGVGVAYRRVCIEGPVFRAGDLAW